MAQCSFFVSVFSLKMFLFCFISTIDSLTISSYVPLLYPLKTSEHQPFSDIFWGYRNETLDCNGWTTYKNPITRILVILIKISFRLLWSWDTCDIILKQMVIWKKKYLRTSTEKCPNKEFFSGSYFPLFRLNAEIYCVNLRIETKYGKIKTRENSVFGHFSHSALLENLRFWISMFYQTF